MIFFRTRTGTLTGLSSSPDRSSDDPVMFFNLVFGQTLKEVLGETLKEVLGETLCLPCKL